jgi:MoxR-like ATPase
VPLSPDLMAFVQSALRLPEERLKQIDRAWDQLYPHRAVLAELVQSSDQVRQDVAALRDFALAEARRVAAERPAERLIPEDIFEAVFPAARALLLRSILENSSDTRRAQAFAALIAPFADIVPGRRQRTNNGQGR